MTADDEGAYNEETFFQRFALEQGARREMLEFYIALADDRLNKRGDPIACHIYLVEALRGVRLSDELQDEARALLEVMDATPNPAHHFPADRYPGGHDDCIATTPHYHERPYRIGEWGPR